MSLPLDAFTGDVIYIDTMLPYLLLRGVDPAIKTFFERIERGDFSVYTSALTFDELAYRLTLAFIKDRYPGSPLDRLRGEEARMLAEFTPQVVALLRRLRELPHLIILDVLGADLDAMTDAMSSYLLRPRDALHFAAMQRIDCFNIASNDPHFDRVPAIQRYSSLAIEQHPPIG
jgi:predicted nucleic acid-binding protein